MPTVITTENDILTGPAEAEADLGHVEIGLSRLIERWRADKNPNLAAILTSYLEEGQELENAIWFVIYGRMLDYAEGAQLDMLGRIVGQPRNGLSDDRYRVHVRARIRINRSIGTADDVIEVLRLVDPGVTYHFQDVGFASFRLWSDVPPGDAATGHEIPDLVRQTRAAGVGALISFPVDRATSRGAKYGSIYSFGLNANVGYSSIYDPTVGGFYGHAVTA